MTNDLNEVIDIDSWQPDESAYEKGYYPEGSRDKGVFLSPATCPLPFKPNWRYLLKQSREKMPWQLWMEVMAYRVGQVMDIDVPACYVGVRVDPKTNQRVHGALIEWFYGNNEHYIKGSDLIAPLTPGFDQKEGKPHCLKTILALDILDSLRSQPGASSPVVLEHWAKVLTLDSVIGNIDRHPDNWGIVVAPETPHVAKRLAPAFDNGTSMAYEIREEAFAKFEDPPYQYRYLTRPRRARHHLQWDVQDTQDQTFYEFLAAFAKRHPQVRPAIEHRLTFAEEQLAARLTPLSGMLLPGGCPLTPRRLDFTLKLIRARVSLLKNAMQKL